MAAAGLFGALGAIGDTGNQVAEGRQMAHDEVVRRLAEQQASQQADLNMQSTRQRIAKEQQDLEAGKQPVPIGTPYVSKNAAGKVVTLQHYQDPITGKTSVQELPGGAPETDPEKTFRGLTAIGISEQDASQAVIKKMTGKSAEKREVSPDPASPTGFSAMYYDTDGNFVWSAPTLPPRTAVPRETDRTSKDQFGNVTTSQSITKPLIGGQGAGGTGRPPAAAGAPASPVAPQGYSSQRPMTTPQGMPAAGSGAAFLQALAAANPPAPPAAAPTPKQRIVQRLAAGPAAAAAASPAAPGGAPGGQGTIAVGTYRGLGPNGEIPPRPGINPQVAEYANDILAGRDVTKIPMKARALAESLARKYGWKGQGSLTPAQQMQIEQVDNSLAYLSQPKFLKLFDSTMGSLKMSAIPLDPTGEGGTGGVAAAVARRLETPEQQQFMNALTRLRGVITGIRGFTGANNSNASASRFLAELPNFTNTGNSADASDKLDRLRQEVAIIKRLGYFLPDDQAPTGIGAPASDNPLNLKLPATGR
jgi:hypothetical protein